MAKVDISRIIETERLILRPHGVEDFAACVAVWGNPEVTRYIGGRPQTPEECWHRLLRYAGHWSLLGFGYWAVEEKASGRFIGDIGFSDFHRPMEESLNFTTAPEVGWVLSPDVHGKGYATEAVQAALGWGDAYFKGQRFVCMIHPDNRASSRVAEKTGFIPYAHTDFKGAPTVLYERPAR